MGVVLATVAILQSVLSWFQSQRDGSCKIIGKAFGRAHRNVFPLFMSPLRVRNVCKLVAKLYIAIRDYLLPFVRESVRIVWNDIASSFRDMRTAAISIYTAIRRDLQIPTVTEEIRRYSSQYRARLSAHPNGLVVDLFELPDNRRLRRHLPNDLPTRFLV
jgi:hypothetical protein